MGKSLPAERPPAEWTAGSADLSFYVPQEHLFGSEYAVPANGDELACGRCEAAARTRRRGCWRASTRGKLVSYQELVGSRGARRQDAVAGPKERLPHAAA